MSEFPTVYMSVKDMETKQRVYLTDKELLDLVELHEAWLKSTTDYTQEKARLSLGKEPSEIEIEKSIPKVEAKDLPIQRKKVAKILFTDFEYESRDEFPLWTPYKLNQQIKYEHKNKVGEIDYVVKATPKQILNAKFLDRVAHIAGDEKQLRRILHDNFDGYELAQDYPLDKAPDHIFILRLKWKLRG